jgi:hypothetical protein
MFRIFAAHVFRTRAQELKHDHKEENQQYNPSHMHK